MNSTFNLPDERVAIADDWHGDRAWSRAAIRAIAAADPSIRTVLHLGDFWPDRMLLRAVDAACKATGIERVLLTVGNHEPYDWIRSLLHASPDGAAKISDFVYILQRPQRLTIAGRVFLSLGGAASVDREWREPGRDWWPDERITDAQVEATTAGGACGVMLTHESPSLHLQAAIFREAGVLRCGLYRWVSVGLSSANASGKRVAKSVTPGTMVRFWQTGHAAPVCSRFDGVAVNG